MFETIHAPFPIIETKSWVSGRLKDLEETTLFETLHEIQRVVSSFAGLPLGVLVSGNVSHRGNRIGATKM